MAFNDLIDLIKKGELVAPGTPNRPLSQLDQNIRYLRDILNAASVGSTIYARGVTVEGEASVGMPVYWSSLRQRFERALAAIDSSSGEGVLLTAESSQVWGIIGAKQNSTLADILLSGYEQVDISAAVDGDVKAGVYYLSASTPGMLTQQRPPVSVPVLRHDGNGKVFVNPTFVDFLDRHVHYKFSLVTLPAGKVSAPSTGERHVIEDPDPDKPGWLPAKHSVFAGTAPKGAAFGYNMSQHPDLKNAWPPIPVDQVQLVWDKGDDMTQGGHDVALGPDGLVVVDQNGIWWMSDCFDDVPWPTDLDTSISDSAAVSDSASAECPRNMSMSLTLWFSSVRFMTDTTAVTSLKSNDSRITITCQKDGEEASAGDLAIDIDFDLISSDDTQSGHLVVKELQGNDLLRGPVLEGIYPLSDNVTIASSDTSKVNINGVERTVYQGIASIEVSKTPSRLLSPQIFRLDGVTEEFFQDLMTLQMPADETTSIRAKIAVPADTELASPSMKIRLILMGRASGSLPSLTLTARRIARPSNGLLSPLAWPDSSSEFTITIDTTASLSSANTYVEAESSSFTVAAGDLVFIKLERSESDSYGAGVDLVEMTAVLDSGS